MCAQGKTDSHHLCQRLYAIDKTAKTWYDIEASSFLFSFLVCGAAEGEAAAPFPRTYQK
jgi:hypothetical protein